MVYDVITQKNPQQMRFEIALWTREMVQELILKKYKFKLGLKSISKLLAQLGITCQKPLYKAIQKDDTLVRKWLKKIFSTIKKRALKERVDVYFGDAAHMRSDHHSGRTWGITGKTPVATTNGSRFGLSPLSAITSKGHMRFMIVEGGVSSDVFVKFLKRLLIGALH